MYRPLASGIVAARMCALATSRTSMITGVPAMLSLSKQAYCIAHRQVAKADQLYACFAHTTSLIFLNHVFLRHDIL